MFIIKSKLMQLHLNVLKILLEIIRKGTMSICYRSNEIIVCQLNHKIRIDNLIYCYFIFINYG